MISEALVFNCNGDPLNDFGDWFTNINLTLYSQLESFLDLGGDLGDAAGAIDFISLKLNRFTIFQHFLDT